MLSREETHRRRAQQITYIVFINLPLPLYALLSMEGREDEKDTCPICTSRPACGFDQVPTKVQRPRASHDLTSKSQAERPAALAALATKDQGHGQVPSGDIPADRPCLGATCQEGNEAPRSSRHKTDSIAMSRRYLHVLWRHGGR